MKVIFNTRIDHNMNTSFSFEHIVANEEDATELGEADMKLFKAYMEGVEKAGD